MYKKRYWPCNITMSLTKHISMARLVSYQVSAVLADSEFWWWAGKNGSRLSPLQLLHHLPWCPRSRGRAGLVLSHAAGSAGLGAGALTLLYVLAQGVSSERPRHSISRLLMQRAAPAAQTSAWDVISYLKISSSYSNWKMMPFAEMQSRTVGWVLNWWMFLQLKKAD